MLDERLARHFRAANHQCVTVREAGLKGVVNGELLTAAEIHGFNVMVTTDKGIQYQSNLIGRQIAVVVIRVYKNKLSSVLPHIPEALRVLASIRPGTLKYVGEPSLVAKHAQS